MRSWPRRWPPADVRPPTVALHDGDAFIVESRFDPFFGIDRTPADVPFVVTRVWPR